MSIEYVPLRYVTTVLARGTAPNYVDDGPVRMVSQAANQDSGLDWQRTRFHDFAGDPRKLKGYLQSGDSLVNSTGTGTLGRVGWFEKSPDDRPCVADGHVTVTRFDPARVDKRFGFYYLKSDVFQELMFETLVTGSTNQIELSGERMRAVSMPVPPLEQQRRIADFLDAETARIDSMSSKRDVQVSLMEERLISNAVVRTGRVAVRSVEETTRRPAVVPIRRVVRGVKTGATPPTAGPDVWSAPGQTNAVPWYGPSSFGDLLDLKDPVRYLNSSLAEAKQVPLFSAGSVVVVGIGATAGKVGYLDAPGASNQQITALFPEKGVFGKFLAWQLWSAAKEFRDLAPYTTLPIINNEFLKSFPVAVLSEQEQVAVAADLDKEAHQFREFRAVAERESGLLSERRQALITAAVTGEFDVSAASGRGIEE